MTKTANNIDLNGARLLNATGLTDANGNLIYTVPDTAFRKNIAEFGVVYGTGLSTPQRTANTNAFQAALNSRRQLFYSDNVEINGLLSTNGIPISLVGGTLTAQIIQTAAVGVFLCGMGSELFYMENVNIFPAVNVPNAYAVKVTGAGGNTPNIQVKNVVVNHGTTVNNATPVFEGGGFWFINYGEGLCEHCKYYGRDRSIGDGIYFTNTVVSVSGTVRDFKLYGGKNGIRFFSTGNPGIEGLRLMDIDTVTCDKGITYDSDGVYGTYYPVMLNIIGGHFNAFTAGIQIRRAGQVNIFYPLVYLENDASQGGVGIDIDYTTNFNLIGPEIFKNGVGAVNGILIGENAYDGAIAFTNGRLVTGDALCLISSGASRITANHNKVTGASYCVFDQNGGNHQFNYLDGVMQGNGSQKLTGNVQTVNVPSGCYTVYPAAGNGTPDTNKTWNAFVSHDQTDSSKRAILLIDSNDARFMYVGTVQNTAGTAFSGWSRALNDLIDLPGLSKLAGQYNYQTGTSYTFQESDCGKIVVLTNSATVTLTVPPGLSSGWNAAGEQGGAGQVAWANGSGVTVTAYPGGTKTAGKGARVSFDHRGSNQVMANGQMA